MLTAMARDLAICVPGIQCDPVCAILDSAGCAQVLETAYAIREPSQLAQSGSERQLHSISVSVSEIARAELNSHTTPCWFRIYRSENGSATTAVDFFG